VSRCPPECDLVGAFNLLMKYQHVTCQYNILRKYLINVPQKPAPRLLTQRGQEVKAEKGDERMRGQAATTERLLSLKTKLSGYNTV
jgi:hypothetical protein